MKSCASAPPEGPIQGFGSRRCESNEAIPGRMSLFASDGTQLEGTHLTQSDLDNFARIPGHVCESGARGDQPRLAALLIDRKPR